MENPLQSLPPGVRRLVVAVWGGTFIIVLFGLVPGWAAEQSRELGWPRWQGTAGKVVGVTLFLASFGLVLYCSRLFSSIGKGTPVPIDPPRERRSRSESTPGTLVVVNGLPA